MKARTLLFVRRGLPLIAVALPMFSTSIHGASITWNNSGTDFNAGASWTGSVAPGVADVATFTGARVTNPALSAAASVKGLAFSDSAASAYTISGNTLTLGTSGIDASAVTSGTNTISSSLNLASGGQTWTSGAGSTIALNTGTFTRAAGSTLNIQGTGTISSSMSGIANTNGIVGPWATVGSGNTIRFATLTAGNLVSYTGATVNGNWTGTMNNAATNYDVTAGSNTTFGASTRSGYTVRYLGGADTLTLGNNLSGSQLATNCLINAGTGTLNLVNGTGSTTPAGLAAGSTNGVILVAANADLNVSARVHNNGANASTLTLVGPGVITLSGVNDFTGGAFVNSGTVQIGNNAAFGTGTLTINGGNIRATGADRTMSNAVSINNNFTLGRGTHFSGAVTLNNDITITSANPDVLAASTSSFTGAISGSRNLTFTEGTNPIGTIILSGANAYTGATTINGGTVQLNGTGSINSSSGITINGATAKLVQTSTTASTPAISLQNGKLDGTGTVGAVTVADNASNLVTNGNGGTNSLTLASLAFGGDATVSARLGSSTPIIVNGALSTTPANGQVSLVVPGAIPIGLYDLISYGSFGGSLSDFAITLPSLGPRQNATPQLHGNNIAVNVSGENIVWSGAGDDVWDTATTGDDGGTNNWARKTAHTATNFWAADTVEFNDTYNLGAGAVPVTRTSVYIAAAVSPASTTFNNSAVDYEISGTSLAGGSLTKNGTGTVTLLTANTYTGATVINQGILKLGNGSTDGSIAGTSGVTNNAALHYNPATSQTAAYPISGTGSLVKQGFGTLTLTGANTYSGGTTVSEGFLIAGTNGLNGGPITLNAGGTLTFTGNNQVSTSTLTGAGSILNNTANTIVITGDHSGFSGSFTHGAAANNTQFNSPVAGSQNASYSLSAGEIIFAASGDYTVKFGSLSSAGGNIRGGNTATGTTTVEVGNLGSDSIIAGNFSNGATKVLSLQKVGSGTLTLNGGANYTGATVVNAGTLAFGNTPKTLGGSAFTVADGAGLSVKAAAAGTTMLPTNSLTLGASTLTFDFNSLSPTVTQVSTGTLTLNGALTVNFLNTIALGTGTYKLIDYTSLTGTGTLPGGSFSVGNRANATIVENTLDTSIDLVVTSDTPKWTGLDSGEWLAGSTGSNKNWKLGTSGTATDYLDDDQVLFDDTASGTRNVVIDASFVFPASTTFNTATSDYTVSGASGIGSGSLTKSGSGSVTISTANIYTGTTTINAGTLQLGNGTTDGSITNTVSVTNNGTLAYNLAADQTAPYPVSGTGNITKTGAGALTLTGANTYAGGTSLNAGVINLAGNGTLGTGAIAVGTGTTLNINKNLALTNTVTGGGAIVNTGTLTNTGDFSSFTGSFTHNSNAVSVAFNSAITTSQNAAYHIASDQGSVQGMIAGGNGDYTLKLGALSGVANSLFRGGLTATGTTILEIGNLGTDTEFAGQITNGTNKFIGLTKVGTGTLTLSGACTYTASTLVNVGTLNVTGSLAAATSVTVNSGATLKGTGTVAGTVAGSGTISPGVSVGTLTTGTVTLTGTLAIEIDGATGDKLVSTGAIDLTGSTLSVTPLSGGFTEASYVIAEGTSITGTFASIPSGYSVSIVSGGAGQQAVLTSTAAGYASWAATHAGGQAANLDFDTDGVANGVEYFMNSAAGFTANPAIVSGAITWPNGGNIPASAYGTQFVVQTSSDLSSWTDVPVGSLTTNTNSALTYTLPTGAGKIFARLVVTPN